MSTRRTHAPCGDIVTSGLAFIRLGEEIEVPFFDTTIRLRVHKKAAIVMPLATELGLKQGPSPEILPFKEYIRVDIHGMGNHPDTLFNRISAVIQISEEPLELGLFTVDISASQVGQIVQLLYVVYWDVKPFQGPWKEVKIENV